jgi:ParB family chromosome partitioning protein
MSTTSTPTHPKPVETGSIQGAEYKEIPLDNLTPSKLNPRRRFDPKAMEELTLSVKAKGILQPLLVRKNGTGKGRDSGAAGAGGCESYEIVAGQRRARAAKAAGLAAVPCVIRALTDQEALESMVIENLQRADVHPLEEAAGYKQLMAMAGQGAGKMDVGAIAAKVGRSVAYIYDRVKLCALIPEAQKIFLADKITAGHAILLARLAPEDQKRCIDPDRASEGYGRLGGLWTGEYRLSLDDEECKEA